jgi:hypothetical protein
MSTIKTTGTGAALRVIIKAYIDQVRVSCECCEPDCCILPADYDWEYQEEDYFAIHFSGWPEQLRVNWTGHLVGNIDKSATLFQYQTGNIRIRRNDDFSSYYSRAWILEDLTDPANIVTRTIGRCLIRGDGGITPGDNLVEDLWADQYITNPVGSFYPPYNTYTVTFTRVSLCEWVATSGYPPECDPWTLSFIGPLNPTIKGGGFQIVINDYDSETEFCTVNAEENGFFYPDGGIYNSNENYSITLTPV